MSNIMDGVEPFARHGDMPLYSPLQIAAAVAHMETMEELRDYVIVQRPGMVPDRKGPFANQKHLEDMLRELYEIYPDCTCTVIELPGTSYPQSGREWVAMYGDKRRKKLPPEVTPNGPVQGPP